MVSLAKSRSVPLSCYSCFIFTRTGNSTARNRETSNVLGHTVNKVSMCKRCLAFSDRSARIRLDGGSPQGWTSPFVHGCHDAFYNAKSANIPNPELVLSSFDKKLSFNAGGQKSAEAPQTFPRHLYFQCPSPKRPLLISAAWNRSGRCRVAFLEEEKQVVVGGEPQSSQVKD